MTTLELWNLALGMIPHDKTILDEAETSTEAKRCRMFWLPSRVKVLSVHDWTFATRTIDCSGGLHQGLTGSHWVFPKPHGAIKIIGVFDARGQQLEVYGRDDVLVSATPMAQLRYVADVPNPDDMPDLVQVAVAWELAAQIAPLITSGGIRLKQIAQQAAIALGDARQADSSAVEGGGVSPNFYAEARR